MVYYRSSNNPFNFFQVIIGLIVFFTLLYIGFYIAKSVLIGLAFVAPVLLIAAMVLNIKTIRNFGKYLVQITRVKPLFGFSLILLSIIAFPVTCLILFLRSRSQWVKRKKANDEATSDGSEYIDYIELDKEGNKNFDSIKNYH